MNYIQHGSSKDLFYDEKPTAKQSTSGVFRANNEFSVFDIGGVSEKSGTGFQFTIPLKFIYMDEIIMATYEAMERAGVPTCYLGANSNKNDYGSYVQVLRVPGKDGFPKDPNKVPIGEPVRVVDVEFIYNYILHPRSSLLRNFKEGTIDFRKYGFTGMPNGGEVIPIAKDGNVPIKHTTKFDDNDRDLTPQQAKERSRLTDDQWNETTKILNEGITATSELAREKGLLVCDGKREIGVGERYTPSEVMICDVVENETDRWLVELDINEVVKLANNYLDDCFFYENPNKKKRFRVAMQEHVEKVDNGSKLWQDADKQYIRDWFIDNGWQALNKGGKSVIPPLMPNRPLIVYSECGLALAERISGKDIGAIVEARIGTPLNQPLRPLETVAAEMFVLTELNKAGFYPIDVIA